MIRNTILITVLFFSGFLINNLSAQGLSYGFKVGLNSSKIVGDLELDDAGMEVEENDLVTGFHVGATILYNFTDNYGVKADIMFSQKGARYRYNGQSFYIFNALSGEEVLVNGTQQTFLRITNSYLDIPIMAYARFNWIELSAGINVGFLMGSAGEGETIFGGNSFAKNDPVNIIYNLDHNYFKDEATSVPAEDAETIEIIADGETINFPKTVSAYYGYANKDGNVYNRVDLGLNGGVSFFINDGLYFGLRANYGLSDLTNSVYERSQVKPDGFEYISRTDTDVNLSFQASVGFTF